MPSKHAPKGANQNPPQSTEENVAEPEQSASGGSFVPTEEFKQWQGLIESQLSAISANVALAAQNATRSAPTEPIRQSLPAIAEPTDEEIQAAFEEGKGAAMVRRLAAIEAEKRERSLIAEHINPLREVGLGAINRLTRSRLEDRLPYFKKYEKEIQGYLDQLPPDALANEAVYEVAHAKVVADHMDEIIQERVRAAMTSEDSVGDPIAAIVRPRTQEKMTDKVPTVAELCGADAEQALKQRGLSPDQFARNLGYADWASYAKLAGDMEAQ